MARQPQQGAAPAVQPGQFFDFPGYPGGATQWTEQDESSTNQATVHSSTQQVPISGLLPFKQTDVATDWQMILAVAQTYTAGTSALTASAYAPFNVLGPVQLKIQNQYASVDVESGVDLYIFNLIRPYSASEVVSGVNMGANPAGFMLGDTAKGYEAAALAQPNNINGAAAAALWSSAATSYVLNLRLPAAQWFDEYYDLAITGEAVTQPHSALVSPQFMAGTTRNIIPKVTINPGNAAITDGGNVNIGAGTGTYVGSSVARFRRRAVYSGDAAVLPPVYAWQYSWKTTRFATSGQTKVNIQFPLDTGQILSTYVRMFDPAAAGGLGAPIALSTLVYIALIYGSGLEWWSAGNDGGVLPATLIQREWFAKHSSLLPAGVFAWDLALDERQQMSNKRALNTLTTGGLQVRYTAAAPLSLSSYAVLGTESLVYVS